MHPQRMQVLMRSGQRMGGEQFGPSQERRNRVRGQAFRPKGFCGPQFGMGMGPGGFAVNIGPADVQNMMQAWLLC